MKWMNKGIRIINKEILDWTEINYKREKKNEITVNGK